MKTRFSFSAVKSTMEGVKEQASQSTPEKSRSRNEEHKLSKPEQCNSQRANDDAVKSTMEEVEEQASQKTLEKSKSKNEEHLLSKREQSNSKRANDDEPGLSGYVHNLSPIKKSRRGTSFYNLIFQTESENFRAVGYKMDVHKQLNTSQNQKSPVKLVKTKFVPNYINPQIKDITISNNSKVTVADDVSFTYGLKGSDVPPLLKVSEIMEQACFNDLKLSSVELYLKVKHQMVVTTSSQYTNEPLSKKECKGNDETGLIKVVLYGIHVENVVENGCYKIEFASVRRYGNDVQLNCNRRTTIIPIEDKITPSTEELDDLVPIFYQFPPRSVKVLKYYTCPTSACEKVLTIDEIVVTRDEMIRCTKCQNRAKSDFFKIHYELHFTFEKDGVEEQVRMYRYQVDAYFECKKTPVPGDEDQLSVHLLNDDATTIICNKRNTCIGIKKT